MKTVSVAIVLLLVMVSAAAAQLSGVAPTLIPLAGELKTAAGDPRTGSVLLVISLYEGQDDPAPRWIEHQLVTLSAAGGYDVQFGGTREEGLPADLFLNAATRWIGVAVENEAEQPRMMLISVPYAARAGTADTLAGRTASDFVLVTNLSDQVRAALSANDNAASGSESGPGISAVTLNFLQKGTGSGTTTTDSTIVESSGNVGIGTASPGARLDIRDGGLNIDFTSGAQGFSIGSLATPGRRVTTGYKMSENFGFTDVYDDSAGVYRNYRFNAANIILNNDTGGNVGIGTSSPGAKLHVSGGGMLMNNGRWFQWKDSGGNGQNLIRLSDGDVLTFTPAKSGGGIYFTNFASNLNNVAFLDNGNVGIGTSSPSSKLHVAGAALITGNLTVDGNIGAKYQDVAEWVDSVEPLAPGTVVIIDPSAKNRVMAAGRSYDLRVAGAVSAQPGVVLGEPGPGRVLVAQSGRVRIKVDARNGAIRAGDLLVTSPKKGYAMRSRPVVVGETSMHRPGTVLGKALEPLATGTGEVLVLLTLQ